MGITKYDVYDVCDLIPLDVLRQLFASASIDKVKPCLNGFWWWKGLLFSTDTHRMSMFYDIPATMIEQMKELPEGRYEAVGPMTKTRALVRNASDTGRPPSNTPTIINSPGRWHTVGEWNGRTKGFRIDGSKTNASYMPIFFGAGKIMASEKGQRMFSPVAMSCEVDWITASSTPKELKGRFVYILMPMQQTGVIDDMPWPETPIGIGPGPTFFAGHEWGCKELPAWSA